MEGVLVVGVVEVPPDAYVGSGDLEPLQPRHRHAHVVQLRQDLAVLKEEVRSRSKCLPFLILKS